MRTIKDFHEIKKPRIAGLFCQCSGSFRSALADRPVIPDPRLAFAQRSQCLKKIATGPNATVALEAYDDQGRLIGVYTPDGSGGLTVIEELVYLDGWRAVATIRPDPALGMASPAIYPIVSDHLGSPRKILDQAGTLLWSWTNTEPYGYQAPNELHSGSSFVYDGRFPGQRFDRSTGALHNGFRTYSPKLGRYMQSDPLGLEAGWNTYGYVSGYPVGLADYLGLSEKDVKRLTSQFHETVQRMTDQKVRHADPRYNNQLGKWEDTAIGFRNPLAWAFLTGNPSGSGHEVCSGQTCILSSDLTSVLNEGTDDRWAIANPYNGSHYWIELTSSNPKDPKIWMDPWAGQISIGAPCTHCIKRK